MTLVTSLVMTISVIIISTICILLALGYRFDFTSNKVEQAALLQLDSFPDQATVFLDNVKLSFKTAGKIEVSAGAHDVTMQRSGYRDWTKHFTVKPGEVYWLSYARLIPTTVATDSLHELSGLAGSIASPDHKQIVALVKSDSQVLEDINVSDPTKVTYTTITLPSSTYSQPAGASHTFRLVEWSLSSKYFLVQHDTSTGVREYIRVSATDTNDIVNVSAKFGLNFSDMHFSSDTTFYALENGNVRRVDLGSSSLSEPLVKDVTQMKLYGSEDLAYVRHTNASYEVGVAIGGTSPHVVSTYDDATPLIVDISKYYNEYYVAVTRGASFELIKNPQKTAKDGLVKVVTLTYPGDIKWLDFSNNGRFVIAGNGAQFMTYDSELQTTIDVNFPSLLTDPTIRPQWLDDFVLVSTADNKLRLSDYSGDNQQIITDALPAQTVMLSSDGTLLYSFTKSQIGTVSLQVSKMTTD